jgi:translation initiation factor IF-2
MENEFMKRGYLLPEGCKDLLDALNLKEKQDFLTFKPFKTKPKLASLPKPSVSFSPAPALLFKEIKLSAPITVGQLAEALKAKPFAIVADLMEMGIFASLKQSIDFGTASSVALKYGYLARKA